ncbi:MAG TPA: hypothetical protein PLK63_01565 [Catalimonadaceae bacterium]|nr:hypothetical protein [Catalimonadaceae bacterium]
MDQVKYLIPTTLLIGFLTINGCSIQKDKYNDFLYGCGNRPRTIGMAYIRLYKLNLNLTKYNAIVRDSGSSVIIELRNKKITFGGGAYINVDTLTGKINRLELYQ